MARYAAPVSNPRHYTRIQIPRVSVIIPTYNVESYIDEALTSIRSQTLDSLEIICVDDGSTDATIERLREHASADPRVRVFAIGTNRGPSAARNCGIEAARGEFVYFLDSDDVLEVNALRELVDLACAENLDVVYFGAVPFSSELTDPVQTEAFRRLYSRSRPYELGVSGAQMFSEMHAADDWTSSVCLYMMRRHVLTAAEIRFTEGYLHEDHWFSIAVALAAPRAACVQGTPYQRRIRSGSIMTKRPSAANAIGLLQAAGDILRRADSMFLGDTRPVGLSQALASQVSILAQEAARVTATLEPADAAEIGAWIDKATISTLLLREVGMNLERANSAAQSADSLAAARAECHSLHQELAGYQSSRVLRMWKRLRRDQHAR